MVKVFDPKERISTLLPNLCKPLASSFTQYVTPEDNTELFEQLYLNKKEIESKIKNPTWTDNSASRDLEGYNIYRDCTFLDNSGYNTEYFDFNLLDIFFDNSL